MNHSSPERVALPTQTVDNDVNVFVETQFGSQADIDQISMSINTIGFEKTFPVQLDGYNPAKRYIEDAYVNRKVSEKLTPANARVWEAATDAYVFARLTLCWDVARYIAVLVR